MAVTVLGCFLELYWRGDKMLIEQKYPFIWSFTCFSWTVGEDSEFRNGTIIIHYTCIATVRQWAAEIMSVCTKGNTKKNIYDTVAAIIYVARNEKYGGRLSGPVGLFCFCFFCFRPFKALETSLTENWMNEKVCLLEAWLAGEKKWVVVYHHKLCLTRSQKQQNVCLDS